MPVFVFNQGTESFGQWACAAASRENNWSVPEDTGGLWFDAATSVGESSSAAERTAVRNRRNTFDNPSTRRGSSCLDF